MSLGNSLTYREESNGKDTTQHSLLFYSKGRLQEHGHGDQDDHDIGRKVENGIRDQMVCRSRALGFLIHISANDWGFDKVK
jgi:hypothetical protein